jgi:hypothetical protein
VFFEWRIGVLQILSEKFLVVLFIEYGILENEKENIGVV